jgi:hypothetical protein
VSIRPKPGTRNDDTVYDKNRVDTRKGQDPDASKAGSKKPVTARALPVAKPLDSLPGDRKSLSGANPIVTSDAVRKAGSAPTAKAKTTSGAVPIVRTAPAGVVTAAGPSAAARPAVAETASRSVTPAVVPAAVSTKYPAWMLISASVAGAVLVLAALLVLGMAIFGGNGGGARGASSLHTDGQRSPPVAGPRIEG